MGYHAGSHAFWLLIYMSQSLKNVNELHFLFCLCLSGLTTRFKDYYQRKCKICSGLHVLLIYILGHILSISRQVWVRWMGWTNPRLSHRAEIWIYNIIIGMTIGVFTTYSNTEIFGGYDGEMVKGHLHIFTVMQPFKLGKHMCFYDIQNVSQYLVSYHYIYIISIFSPTLTEWRLFVPCVKAKVFWLHHIT